MPRRVLTRDEVAQPSGVPRLRGDSLTRDLVVAYTPTSDINLASGKLMQRQLVTTEASTAGLAGRATGLGTEGIDTGATISGMSDLTVLVVAARMSDTTTSGNPATVQAVVHSSNVGPTLHRWQFVLGNGFGPFADRNKPRFIQQNGGFSASGFEMWVDGRLQSSANPADVSLENLRFYTILASGNAMEGDAPVFLFGRVFTSDFGGDIRMALALVWRRNLSEAEKQSVSANPWQVFEPARRNRSRVRPLLSQASVIDVTATTARPVLNVTF
jgi:hypothetical protein